MYLISIKCTYVCRYDVFNVFVFFNFYIGTHELRHIYIHIHICYMYRNIYICRYVHVLHAVARLEVASLSSQGEVFSKREKTGEAWTKQGHFCWWFWNSANWLTYTIYIYIVRYIYMILHMLHYILYISIILYVCLNMVDRKSIGCVM